jgi:hypothetical protein
MKRVGLRVGKAMYIHSMAHDDDIYVCIDMSVL